MNSKLIGGILLVIGTTIGAGMLALPVATAQLGFWGSTVLLVSAWALMTTCALLFLEVNLWLPPNTNLISMAGLTLGRAGQAIAWVFYLFLLYAIICSYVAGGGDLFHYVLSTAGFNVPLSVSSLLFTALFGTVVFFGIKCVDYVNRGLMFGKMGAYVLLVLLILPFVSATNLSFGDITHIASPTSITVTAVAFCSFMIIPSLRTYFGEDIKSLRQSIVIGTFIPLLCYIAWNMAILGIIPFESSAATPGLKDMMHSASTNSDLVAAVSNIMNKAHITMILKFFMSICMTTSFLSVSLSLSDFLSDGLRVAKKGIGNVVILGATFAPPVLIVLIYPDAFIRALNYAGVCSFVLMILFPAIMAWRGRYHRDLASTAFRVRGGKFLLAILVVFATLMVGFGLEGAI